MKKIFALIMTAILLVTALAACTPAGESGSKNPALETGPGAASMPEEEKKLNLFTWENMFPQDVLDAFTQETGIEVNYANFDTDETMLAKLETAKGGDYDVVIADDYIIETAIAQGLVAKLDKAKISHYGSINPLFQGQFFDKTDEYTVPYGSGVQTIIYDPAVVKTEITGYADLWSPELKGNIGITSNYRVMNGMALKIMGESYNTTDVAKIAEAGQKMQELAPNIRLIKDDNLQDDLLSGEVGAAVMYTSQVTLAMLENPDLKVVYPTEGLGFGIMAQFVPVNAPHPEAAHKFIDYILTPEVSAKCFEYMGYYCTNKDADALIAEEYRPFLTLPAEFTADKMEMIGNVSADAEAEHTKVWTEFKTTTE